MRMVLAMVELGERLEQHDARRVDDDVDAAEPLLGVVEERARLGLVGDVGAERARGAAGLSDPGDDLLGAVGVTGVGGDDSETVGREALDDGAANATRAAGHDRGAGLSGDVGRHGFSSLRITGFVTAIPTITHRVIAATGIG